MNSSVMTPAWLHVADHACDHSVALHVSSRANDFTSACLHPSRVEE